VVVAGREALCERGCGMWVGGIATNSLSRFNFNFRESFIGMGNVHLHCQKRVVNKNKNKTNLLQIFYHKEICQQSCNVAIKCINMSI